MKLIYLTLCIFAVIHTGSAADEIKNKCSGTNGNSVEVTYGGKNEKGEN